MGMWACEEVEPQAERTAARAIFALCVLGAVAACIVALVSAVHARNDPPVSASFVKQDIPLPYFYICPSAAQAVPENDGVILWSFIASCQFLSRDAPPITLNGSAPLHWNASRTPDRTFEINNSNCPVRSVWLDSLLCFEYNLTQFTVRRNDYLPDSLALTLTFGYRSPPDDPLFLRSFWLTSTMTQTPLPDQTNASAGFEFFQELPLSQQAKLTLALTDVVEIGGQVNRTGVGESIYSIPLPDAGDLYPNTLNEIVSAQVQFDTRGVYVVRQIDPLNVSSLLAQFYSFWGYAIGVFGAFFGLSQKREASWRKWLGGLAACSCCCQCGHQKASKSAHARLEKGPSDNFYANASL